MTVCPHCGYESAQSSTCPLCGTSMAAPAAPVEERVPSAPPAWEDSTASFPWNLIDTWRKSVLEPSSFFAGVPYERAAARPILYYLIIAVASSFFWLWWTAAFSAAQVSFLAPFVEMYEPLSELGSGTRSRGASALLNFFLAPFSAIISLIVWSLILHLFVLIIGRERRNLTATVRTISYAAGPSILTVVPFVGWMVGGVWTLVLTVIGLREAHRMSTGGAVAAVLLAFFIPLLILGTLFVLLLAVAASLMA